MSEKLLVYEVLTDNIEGEIEPFSFASNGIRLTLVKNYELM